MLNVHLLTLPAVEAALRSAASKMVVRPDKNESVMEKSLTVGGSSIKLRM